MVDQDKNRSAVDAATKHYPDRLLVGNGNEKLVHDLCQPFDVGGANRTHIGRQAIALGGEEPSQLGVGVGAADQL